MSFHRNQEKEHTIRCRDLFLPINVDAIIVANAREIQTIEKGIHPYSKEIHPWPICAIFPVTSACLAHHTGTHNSLCPARARLSNMIEFYRWALFGVRFHCHHHFLGQGGHHIPIPLNFHFLSCYAMLSLGRSFLASPLPPQ